jgi:hypothetical protein
MKPIPPPSETMPRRKYGHMVKDCPPTPPEKCRICRLGKQPCPVHKKNVFKGKSKNEVDPRLKEKRRKFRHSHKVHKRKWALD